MKIKKHFLKPFLWLCLLNCTTLVYAANHQNIKDAKVSIKQKNARLADILSELDSRTDYDFAYGQYVLDKKERYDAVYRDTPLDEILKNLSEEANFKYNIKGNTIQIAKDDGSSELGFQQTNVQGTITDETGQPLPGASIVEKGTSNGASTDFDGNYTIEVSSADAVLEISYLGYITQEVPTNGQTAIDVQLQPDAGQLDEVVVTALGISREARSLGYVVEKIDGAEVNEIKTVNLQSSLSGKIPGVDITNTANGVAGSKRVVIRGISSITGNNQPLWVIDGIPINSTTLGSATPSGGGGIDLGDGLTGINPDDIESISVLKGNAAAALYGSRASNGVILVNTKSGKNIEKPLTVRYNSTFTQEKALDFSDWQYLYGQGTGGQKPITVEEAKIRGNSGWGAKLDGSNVIQFDGVERPYLPVKDNFDTFYQGGYTFTNTVSLLGGFENHNFRVSASRLDNQDIVPNSTFGRTNLSVNTQSNFDKLSTQVVLNYISEDVSNRQRTGGNYSNVHYTLLNMPTSWDVDDMYPGYDEARNEIGIDNQGVITNPYFVTNRIHQEDVRKRVIGSIQAKYQFFDWLYAKGRIMQDYYSFNTLDYTPAGVIWFPKGGGLSQQWRENLDENYELIIGSDIKLSSDISFGGFIGGNIYKNQADIFSVNGDPFVIEEVFTVNNLENKFPSTQKINRQTNSIFGTLEMSYKNQLFLNFTGRQDWFSTLPKNNNTLFYPSVSASYVFSDAFEMPSWISYGKVRGSFAQVSGDTDPYQLNLTYSLDQDKYEGINLQTIGNSTIPNVSLQPLLSTEYEAGIDLSLFQKAIDLQLTYYNRKTTQDIVRTSVSTTTGYNQAILNVGELSNKGIEIGIQAYPVEIGDFNWSVTSTFSYNKNNVDYLGEELSTIQLAESKTGSAFLNVEEGYPYSAIKGFQYQRNDTDEIVYDANGFPLRTETTSILGNGSYDKLIGLTNKFNWGNISLRIFVDSKFGADIYSEQSALAVGNGKHQMTLEGREEGIIGKGVNESGETNQVRVPVDKLNQYYGRIAGITEEFVYDASFIKLREISLGYTLPRELTSRWSIAQASISLVGRNLAILHKNTPNIDPESNTTSGNAQGIAATVYPNTRSLGLNLNLKF